MKELYEKIRKSIDQADAVLIGASNGLSISEGYNIIADDTWFQNNFRDFRNKYGIHSVLEGSFYNFPSPEEKMGFLQPFNQPQKLSGRTQSDDEKSLCPCQSQRLLYCNLQHRRPFYSVRFLPGAGL